MTAKKAKRNTTSSEWLIARWMLIIRPAVVTATLGAAILLLPPETIDSTTLSVVVFGTYLLTLLYWLAHVFSGVSRVLMAVQIAFDIFIITVIVHIFTSFTGDYDYSFVGFYLLSIMCASLFFRRLITMLFAVQAAIFFGVYMLWVGPALVPELAVGTIRENIILQVGLYDILMFGVAFMSNYYAEKLRGRTTAYTNVLRLLTRTKLDKEDILQSMTNGLIAVETMGKILYINKAAESILHIERGLAEGRPCRSVLGDRVEQLATLIEQQRENPSVDSEIEIVITDDNRRPIPLGLTVMPLINPDGGRRGIIVNFKDLTEKKVLLEMIRQSDRMAAIGELSASIAHEIRNPLASIANAVELLSEFFDTNDPQYSRLLNVIERESERLQRISTDFLKFARIKTPETEPVLLKQAIDDVIMLVENDPRKTPTVTFLNNVFPKTVVSIDRDQMEQVLLNIVINSLDALEGEGEITLSIDKNYEPDGAYCRLVIRDIGPGFPDKEIGSVFEPFFSTKKNGTGLGLALVRKLILANGGRVYARNRPEGGAEMLLDLPTGRKDE